MYLLFLVFGMCAAYFVLGYLFWFVFADSRPVFPRQSLYSILRIAIGMLAVYCVAYTLPDVELGNRILHAFGGGFLAYITCYYLVRDTGLTIPHSKFFIFSFLIVTALGVANELMEFTLQSSTAMVFSPTPTDTWLDLASNTTGTLLAAGLVMIVWSQVNTKKAH